MSKLLQSIVWFVAVYNFGAAGCYWMTGDYAAARMAGMIFCLWGGGFLMGVILTAIDKGGAS